MSPNDKRLLFIVAILAFAAFGQVIHFHLNSFQKNILVEEMNVGLAASGAAAAAANLEVSKVNNNPTLTNFMKERERTFKKRREKAEAVCKDLNASSPLYRPRDATIGFDILWDYHYQVCK